MLAWLPAPRACAQMATAAARGAAEAGRTRAGARGRLHVSDVEDEPGEGGGSPLERYPLHAAVRAVVLEPGSSRAVRAPHSLRSCRAPGKHVAGKCWHFPLCQPPNPLELYSGAYGEERHQSRLQRPAHLLTASVAHMAAHNLGPSRLSTKWPGAPAGVRRGSMACWS